MTALRRCRAEELAAIMPYWSRAANLYWSQPGINLIDIGYKIKDGRHQDKLVVRVHVNQKLPEGPRLEAFARSAPGAVVRDEQVGYETDVIQAGYQLHAGFAPALAAISPASKRRPLEPGIGISNGWEYTYATLGGFVKDRATGAVMILSNYHVLGSRYYIPNPTLPIFQPATADGAYWGDDVARYTRDALAKGMDAAVAQLNPNVDWRRKSTSLPAPAGVSEPLPGMIVSKTGRRTGVTSGVIDGYAPATPFYYNGVLRTITNVVNIVPFGGPDTSEPGDSGSWWLQKENWHAVALHFAGGVPDSRALAISMPKVMEALNVELA